MLINVSNHPLVKIVHITGELNAVTAPQAEGEIIQLILGGNKKLIIELSGLNYISSAGLRVFLVAHKEAKKVNGEILFAGLNNTVKEVYEISGFNHLFRLYPDVETCIANIG